MSGFSERAFHGVSRRGFMAGAAALGGLAATGCTTKVAAPVKTGGAGIQLYTLRAAMAEDAVATLMQVAALGYREVEFAGYFDMTPAQVRSVLNDTGLSAPSAHTNARMLKDEPAKLLDAAAEIGHSFVTIPWLQPEDRDSLDDYKAWAETYNTLGELCRARGMRLAYHNHDFEFADFGGTCGYDILMAGTDPALMDFELDLYWAVKAGQSPVDLFARAPSRFRMCHVKDMAADGSMADIGAGTIDFRTILASAPAASMSHYFAEHDATADPWATAAVDRTELDAILVSIGRKAA